MQTAESLTDEAVARFAGCSDARLRRIMESLVRHVHEFVREVELTPEEWMAGIQFLTATGHKSDALRQEFILLSDTLGVSSLVDALSSRTPAGATESSVLGPFFTDDAPDLERDASIASPGKGVPLLVSGTVRDIRGKTVANAVIDVWENDDSGMYDTQYAERSAPDCRGRMRSAADGSFRFKAVLPTSYSIPSDGPVGMLMGHTARHTMRPAHLHFRIAANGYHLLTTAIYVKGDPYLETDAVFGVKASLVETYPRNDSAEDAKRLGVTSPFHVLDRDFVLVPE
jgi:protocatechuate 3,4-dioxygenase beta subunit